MQTPGVFELGDIAITTAGTQTGTAVTDLDGMLAASLAVRFAYGAGGTSAKVYIATSFDQGTTWCDVACMAFTTASATKIVNLSGLTPKTTAVTPTDGSLADDTVVDGLLGDRLRAKIVVVGTYSANTLVSMRAVVR
jgi:hypothetical protein